jgi:hypothetical protein
VLGDTTFSWARAAVTEINNNTGGSGTGNISETLTNSINSPVNVVYVYTMTANGCTNIQNLTVTVSGTGSRLIVVTPDPQVIKPSTDELRLDVAVLPNPTTTYFNLVIKSNNESSVMVRILDNAGRLVEEHGKVAPNSTLKIGDRWSAGIYFAEMIQNGRRKVIKIVKLN